MSAILLVCLTLPLGQSAALFAPLPSPWTSCFCFLTRSPAADGVTMLVRQGGAQEEKPEETIGKWGDRNSHFGAVSRRGQRHCLNVCQPYGARPSVLEFSFIGRSTDAAMDLCLPGVSCACQRNYLTALLPSLLEFAFFFLWRFPVVDRGTMLACHRSAP